MKLVNIIMKRVRFLLVTGLVLCLGGHTLSAQVKETIDSGNYKIDVTRALPSGGRTINLTSSYTLEIKGDSVISYLPYFGRAYSVPYGGGDGLRFTGKATDYSVTYDKKGTARIKFNTKTPDDNVTFNIQVFTNGSASVNVTPVNRQHISFTGEMKQEE